MHARTKAALRYLGGLLSVGGIGYVVWRFATTGATARLLETSLSGALLAHLLIAIATYTAGLVLLALSWWWLMSAFVARTPPVSSIAAAYAVSQFAKYLPGNVGQYLARHAMLRNLQLPHGALLAAAGLEAASLVVAALVWAAPAAGVFLRGWLHMPAWWLLCALIAMLTSFLVALRMLVVRTRLGRLIPLQRPTRLIGVLAAHVGFFGVMVLSLMIAASAVPGVDVSAWRMAGVATTSWLAGFVVIGSPGGLGVREAVFVELLHGAATESTALLLAATFRAVTFFGDLTFLFLGLLLFTHIRRLDRSRA